MKQVRKLIAVLLAAIVIFSLAVPVFAEPDTVGLTVRFRHGARADSFGSWVTCSTSSVKVSKVEIRNERETGREISKKGIGSYSYDIRIRLTDNGGISLPTGTEVKFVNNSYSDGPGEPETLYVGEDGYVEIEDICCCGNFIEETVFPFFYSLFYRWFGW